MKSVKSAVFYITYKENNNIITNFNNLKNDIKDNTSIDLFCVYDITNSIVDKNSQLNYNLIKINKDIITSAGYKCNYYFSWNGFNNTYDFYGHNIDLVFLYLYTQYPQYDYYWFIEYDVVFNGNWNILFDIDKNVNKDYICSNMKKRNIFPHMVMNCVTFKPNYTNIHCFNPIFRLSNKAIHLLSNLYKQGNWGFYEHYYPSTFLHFNYSIITFNELGFVGGSSNNELNDSTMNYYKRYTHKDITLPNKLYHPLK